MFASLKKFDIHVKAVDGVNQQTILGAVLTIISTFLVLVLIFSEISYFMKIDVVSRMLTDKSVGVEAVKLEFDLQFYDVACNRINFIQEVTRGTVHIHEPVVVEKFAVDDGVTLGCHVRGGILVDKVGGNFRFALEPSQNEGVPGMSSNYSHIVRHIEFTPTTGASAAEKMPDLMDNLRNQVTSVPEGTGAYHYAIQVRHSCATTPCALSLKRRAVNVFPYIGGAHAVQDAVRRIVVHEPVQRAGEGHPSGGAAARGAHPGRASARLPGHRLHLRLPSGTLAMRSALSFRGIAVQSSLR